MMWYIPRYARDPKDTRRQCESPSCKPAFNLVSGGNHTTFSAAVHTSQHLRGPQAARRLSTAFAWIRFRTQHQELTQGLSVVQCCVRHKVMVKTELQLASLLKTNLMAKVFSCDLSNNLELLAR